MASMTASAKRRRELRDNVFGDDSWSLSWKSFNEKRGYACVPRVLPVMIELAHGRGATKGRDCRSTYLELYCRDWGEGIIEVRDEEEHALRAGFLPPRGVRSWRERIRALQEAGFIQVGSRSSRPIGYILLVHPDQVIAALRMAGHVPDPLWAAYGEICSEYGMSAPEEPKPPQTPDYSGYSYGTASGDDDDIPF